MTKHYPDIDANPDFAKLEEQTLKFWQADGTFEKSVNARDPKNAYVFYDGPPFANGLPHYGHLLTGYVKDAIARYQTMNGKRVERRFGWDCHGLPAEMGAEKELGISGRAAIQNFGIDKFNEHCRTSVMKYTHDWEYYVSRQGRWVDFKNDYKTMDTNFMESCVWAFSELYKKGLVYESMRVMPYSWAAETPVSNFETRIDNATREREDKAAYVKFKLDKVGGSLTSVIEHYKNLKDENGQLLNPKFNPQNIYLMAWTTTPWTLPSNLGLAVNASAVYNGYLDEKGDLIFLLSSKVQSFAEKLENKGQIKYIHDSGNIHDGYVWVGGHQFTTSTYEPLFPYFKTAENSEGFKIWPADFVSETDGTGVVHIAPGFGEDDYNLGQKYGFGSYEPGFLQIQNLFDQDDILKPKQFVCPVDEKGRYTNEIFDLPDLKLQGLVVVPDTRIAQADIVVLDEDKAQHIAEKDIAKFGLANMRIVRWLKAHGALVKDESYKHNYPHCWRTDTPLIYRAMSSWYVNVQKIKANMAANNKGIHWIPDHVQEGQMGKGIESAPDWSISRNRFWGTPIPIWRSPSGKLIVPGSIAEIEQLSGQKVKDLHRPYIDEVTFEKDGEKYERVEDVFDCWFESGSMPYAQVHYPFENKEQFEKTFPADFITEYIAQTRGWFYTLQVLSAALFGCAPFKNVICHGVVIDEETGLKYSKRLKNYKDPKEVMDQYGADALRWMMLASPVMRGADLGVDPDGKFIRDIVRLNIKPIWNAYNFFSLYANADGIEAKEITSATDVLDRYVLAKAKAATLQVKASLDAYDTPGACEAISGFFEVLNNWYIRRSKDRFWAEEVNADKQAAYDTLFTVLNIMCKAAAPLLPFTAEAIYRGLNGEASSVHLQDFPDVSKIEALPGLIVDMDRVQEICNAALAVRSKANIRTRQPLPLLTVFGLTIGSEAPIEYYQQIISDELNVKQVRIAGQGQEDEIGKYATMRLEVFSQKVGKKYPQKMKAILAAAKNPIQKFTDDGDLEIEGVVLKQGEEWRVILQPLPEYKDSAMPLPSNDGLVVLDLTITPELEAEGSARDLVRMIQQARKDAGLHVSDKIALLLELPAGFKPAMAHKDFIAEQTLSVSITEGSTAASDKTSTQEVDGEKVVIGISKAA